MAPNNWKHWLKPVQAQTPGNRLRWWIYLFVLSSFVVFTWLLYFWHDRSLSFALINTIGFGTFIIGVLHLLGGKPITPLLSAVILLIWTLGLWWQSTLPNIAKIWLPPIVLRVVAVLALYASLRKFAEAFKRTGSSR